MMENHNFKEIIHCFFLTGFRLLMRIIICYRRNILFIRNLIKTRGINIIRIKITYK